MMYNEIIEILCLISANLLCCVLIIFIIKCIFKFIEFMYINIKKLLCKK